MRLRPARRAIIVVLIFLLMMLSFADRLVVGIAAVPMVKDLGITQTQFGLLGSVYFLLYSVSAILFGRLADRHTSTLLLGWLGLAAVLAHAPVILSATFAGALASRILLGAAQGPVVPLGLHSTFAWFDAEKRGWPTAVVVAGTAAGATLGAPVLSWIIGTWGWQSAYMVLAGVILAWTLAWFAFAQEGPRSGAPTQGSGQNGYPLANPRVVLAAIFIAALVAHGIGIIGVLWAAPYLQIVGGFTLAQAGWIISLNSLGMVITTFLFGSFGRLPISNALSGAGLWGMLPGSMQLIGGCAIAGLGVLPFGWLSLAMMFIGFPLVVSIFVFAPPLLAAIVPDRRRGTWLGAYGACYVLGGLVSPILMGRLLDSAANLSEGLKSGFLLVGLVGAASGFVLLLGRPVERAAGVP